jgi:ABC-type amino acid transport system permease subunit
MTMPSALFRIVVPQAVVIFIPNLGNTIAALLKDTSLVFTIGVVDMMGRAKLLSSYNYGTRQTEIFIAISLIYWGCVLIIDWIFSGFERINSKGVKRMNKGEL